jgi:cellulose synthase/poly-beta-1,6-N-acetylglucosamine synthase-like glycosyltransferase
LDFNLDNQQTTNQNTGNQQNQPRKKPYRKFYYRKKTKPGQTTAESQPVQIKNFSFKKVTVLVPLFNEEESLKPLYNEIKKSVKGISSDYEIIFVDDGSTDRSLAVIKELNRFDNKIRYFSFRTNYGKSAALQVGFKHATGDVVITMDADLQDDPAEIPSLLEKL